MRFFSPLKIRWFNIWIGIIPIILTTISILMINKEATKKAADMSEYTDEDKKIAILAMLIFYGAVIYSIWIPFAFRTVYSVLGAIVYTAGLVFFLSANYKFVTISIDQPIVDGVYKISRHPIYTSTAIMLLGLGIAGKSWVMVILIFLYNVLNHRIVLVEEKACIRKYGDIYRKYMKHVPRYLFFL